MKVECEFVQLMSSLLVYGYISNFIVCSRFAMSRGLDGIESAEVSCKPWMVLLANRECRSVM